MLLLLSVIKMRVTVPKQKEKAPMSKKEKMEKHRKNMEELRQVAVCMITLSQGESRYFERELREMDLRFTTINSATPIDIKEPSELATFSKALLNIGPSDSKDQRDTLFYMKQIINSRGHDFERVCRQCIALAERGFIFLVTEQARDKGYNKNVLVVSSKEQKKRIYARWEESMEE